VLISVCFECVIIPWKWRPSVPENLRNEVLVRKQQSRNERGCEKKVVELIKDMGGWVENNQSRVEKGMCTGLL